MEESKNDIEVVEIKENDDGSCDLTISMSDWIADRLFGIGLQRMIDKEFEVKVKVVQPVPPGLPKGTKTVEMEDGAWEWFIGYAVSGILKDAARKVIAEESAE